MSTETTTELCDYCQELKPVAGTDLVGREYCADCIELLSEPGPFNILHFLAVTIPFKVGDRVACYTAGKLYDGIGIIDEMSMDPFKYGTPVYPSFRVKLTEKAYPEAPDGVWYLEQQLKHVEST